MNNREQQPIAAVEQQNNGVFEQEISRRQALEAIRSGLTRAAGVTAVLGAANAFRTVRAYAAARAKVCHPAHTVKPNETLSGIIIEEGYTESPDQLALENNIANKDLIHPGQVIDGTCPADATVVTGNGNPNQRQNQSASGSGDLWSWLGVIGAGIGIPVGVNAWWNHRKKAASTK